jgi:hypothetical protein
MAIAVSEWLRTVLGPVILIFLGYILFKLVSELIRLSREEDFPRFESNWGGLGRGLGGWSVNRTMVVGVLALLALMLFGSVSFLLVSGRPAAPGSDPTKKSDGAGEGAKQPATVTANPTPAKAADAAPSGGQPPATKAKE